MTTNRREGDAEWVAKYQQTHFSHGLWPMFMKDVRSSDSGSQIVTMMQPAKPRCGYDFVTCTRILHRSTTGRSTFRQREMSSVVMIVTDVLFHQPLEVPFIHNDHMVEQVPTTASDPALSDAILPRSSETGSLRLDTETLHAADHFAIKVRGPVENQIISAKSRRGMLRAVAA